ncbi:NAD(P)-binding domain-containing protein [Cedecea sp. NFIX57]|uniref:NAD(P)-binding domain-containing protein n=1 Tax=Cedecea sp. NFIX57 TaxID=1566286 RepID=UPI000A0B01B9|nr:NAD(P)-binding domain-containing protein [Cedecea sp. NFIX57]SMG33135.1 NADP oxidoreductase coenzyme F420-dependent [Cedecea sp. NFIX57]
MKNIKLEKVFIAGGYGMIGSAIAGQIREHFPAVELVIAGRNPAKGAKLIEQLGFAHPAFIDLTGAEVPEQAANAQLIIAAVPDPKNLLVEFAIKNNIAFINITQATGDAILPLLNLTQRYQPTQPVVPLGYYEAGLFLPSVSLLAADFSVVDHVQLSALHDLADPLGELSSSELGNELAPALIRNSGNWTHSSTPRDITLQNGEVIQGVPFSILDVTAVAAMTHASSVRLDIAAGTSIGMHQCGKPSIDLYVDVIGTDNAGAHAKKRVIASDPLGQAHMTAFGVLTVIRAMLKSDKGGLLAAEALLDMVEALQQMKDAGIDVIRD